MTKKRRGRKRTGPESYYWQETDAKGEPQERPTTYKRRSPLPCMKCDRVLTDHASQAVICLGTNKDMAYLRCRCCSHEFKMQIEAV